MKALHTFALFSSLIVTVAGCAGVAQLQPDASQADVRAGWGAPTLQEKTVTGARWTYSTAPMGRQVWLLDFDANGRLVSRVQGLTIERISRVQNGQTQAEVEALLGPSYWSLRYPFRRDELVHIYRFDDILAPMCFYVGYNDSAVVTSTGMQEEDRSRDRLGRPC
jgi:hypothetical protein